MYDASWASFITRASNRVTRGRYLCTKADKEQNWPKVSANVVEIMCKLLRLMGIIHNLRFLPEDAAIMTRTAEQEATLPPSALECSCNFAPVGICWSVDDRWYGWGD